MTSVPLIFWYDDTEAALKAARKSGRQKDCSFREQEFPEGTGFAVYRKEDIVEKHIVRR